MLEPMLYMHMVAAKQEVPGQLTFNTFMTFTFAVHY